MHKLPAVQIIPHDGISVVRDDLILGGTKVRALVQYLQPGTRYVYASPVFGHAQIALAVACNTVDCDITIFTPKRKTLHPTTRQAIANGADVVQVPYGYMTNLRHKAREYAAGGLITEPCVLLPFGLDTPEIVDLIAGVARDLPVQPDHVWCVAGSGVLTRALQQAWPEAEHNAIQIGAVPDAGNAKVQQAPVKFHEISKTRPPFPSCLNYDAKAWNFITQKPNTLFWNVANEPSEL